MNLFRLKLFFGNDQFGGLLGRIRKSKKRSFSYSKYGPWEVHLTDSAEDEYAEFDRTMMLKIDKVLEEIKTKPYQGSCGQHPLWDYYDAELDYVIWSAEIDKENRITYMISKSLNYISVTNIGGHRVLDMVYAERPDYNT